MRTATGRVPPSSRRRRLAWRRLSARASKSSTNTATDKDSIRKFTKKDTLLLHLFCPSFIVVRPFPPPFVNHNPRH